MSAGLVVMDSIEARALTDRIKVGVEVLWDLVKQAYEQCAWNALGYSSWDEYCTREFGASRLRLPREERAEVVASLRESGLSTRAIAAATGLGATTVRRELSGAPNGAPETAPPTAEPAAECIHCGDTLPLAQLYEGGQGYECDPCVSPDPTETHVPEQQLPPLPENYMKVPAEPEPQPVPDPKPITGLDGKTYTPKPAVPPSLKRKPLPDAFDRAKQELRGAVQKIVRLAADDRLEKNKDQIVGANLSDLIRARDALTSVIQQLEG